MSAADVGQGQTTTVELVTGAEAEDSLTQPADETGVARKGIRWKAVIGLAGLVGLVIAAASTINDTRGQELPSIGALGGAFILETLAVVFVAHAWASLFPPTTDRFSLRTSLYLSQLTKYLPAGGFAQAASQVAMSSTKGSVGIALIRLPIFSLCAVLGGVTCGSVLVLEDDLPTWGRWLAVASLLMLVLLDRRILHAVVRVARRFVRRLPAPDTLPSQREILRCYMLLTVNSAAYASAYALLLGDVADVNRLVAAAAFAGGWAAGYVVLFLPGGIGVREAFLVAALPGLTTGAILAAAVAHRLVGLMSEAVLAGTAYVRTRRRTRAANRS